MRVAALALLAPLGVSHLAGAQECHDLPPSQLPTAAPRHESATDDREPPAPLLAVTTGLRLEAAAIHDPYDQPGSYQGAIPSLELTALGVRARVAVGFYRVELMTVDGSGLGDLQVGLQRAIVAITASTQLGATVSATLPTGDRTLALGMGHPMVMPSLYAHWTDSRSSVLASVGYGRMLASGAHHHFGPLVSPMNPEEVSAAVRGARRLGTRTELAAAVSGALPLTDDGDARAAIAASARWQLGDATELGVELSAPFAGSPIDARGAVDVSRTF
ncbi:MAG TPA: hypothetical protein VFQ53_34635 [Kofleriaceae bacterium]|nr:hypothetical protein [Kofleriaceae bacterium]